LENILYLFRGKAITNERSLKHMKAVLNTLFIQVEKKSEEILRVILTINNFIFQGNKSYQLQIMCLLFTYFLSNGSD